MTSPDQMRSLAKHTPPVAHDLDGAYLEEPLTGLVAYADQAGSDQPCADLLLLSGETVQVSGMRPFFGFYGGKWRDAPKNYDAPRHGQIVEPFAGSAGYSVRFADRKVILGEIDEIIYSVWHYLINASATEIRAIPDLEPDQTVAELDVIQEARWLVGFWLNRGASRPRTAPSAWMRSEIRPGSFWGERARETIASQVDRIRHWRVYNCSYEQIGSHVRGEATWFIDPPYQKQGKHYHHGADEIDFPALARWCRKRRGQVIVCENEGADWLPFRTLADVKTTRASARSVEVVWTNDDPDVAVNHKDEHG